MTQRACKHCLFVEVTGTQFVGQNNYNCKRFPPSGFVIMAQQKDQLGRMQPAQIPGSISPPVAEDFWCYEYQPSLPVAIKGPIALD